MLSMFLRYMHTFTPIAFHNTVRKRSILAAAHATRHGHLPYAHTPGGL